MQQLSGLDAAFLNYETGNAPMHIGSLAIYDQSTAPGGRVAFKDILRFYEQRLHKSRCFRQRVVKVPLSADHPFWIEDPDFDLEFHVRHIALPKPGDWRQLCIQTARLHSRPLDTARPLWEVTVIEGLDNIPGLPEGSFAVVTKIHHAAIDGASGAEMAAAVHDLTPDAVVEAPPEPWEPDRYPTAPELLARVAAHRIGQPLKLARLVAQAAPGLAKAGAAMLKGDLEKPHRTPRTRFNGSVSANRVFDARDFSLAHVSAVRKSKPGITVNDVVLTICGGALRMYLQDKDELPEESLVAMAPMSVRSEGQRAAGGNQVTIMRVPLHSDIDDPGERLRAVHKTMRDAKALTGTMGPGLLADAAEFLPSTLSPLAARLYARTRLAERIPPVFNTVITNVPGARVPLYSMGSRLVGNYGLGPVYDGVGLFQPILSCGDHISISAVSCRRMMPDPSFYMECLEASFAELRKAVKPRVRSAPKKARKKKTAV